MPWGLSIVLTLAIASSPFQWYAARRVATSIIRLTSWRPGRTRVATSIVVFYPLSYPLVTALSPALYQQRSGLVDSLLTYPFWIGVVFAVQLSLLLIVVDLGRLLFYPAYRKLKKDRKRWQRWLRAQAAVTLVLTGAVAAYCGIRVYEDTLGVRVRRVAFRFRHPRFAYTCAAAGSPRECNPPECEY